MASSSTSRLVASFLVMLWSCKVYANGCYPSIISFGDSLADTGNLKHIASVSDVDFPCGPPYGQNFIGHATGRCSNGRLIIDFLAESLGLPLIQPYFNNKGSSGVVAMRQGVNYAVAGATALDSSFIEASWAEHPVVVNGSLGVQLAWFKQSLSSICGNTTSLVGEIGGNDYNLPLITGKSIEEVKSYVPLVIDTIVSTVNELIEMGAQTLVIPGNFPIGCSAAFLIICGSHMKEYDPITNCLTDLNDFAEYHNQMLQTKLNQIQELNPNVIVIYADYYNAAMQIYRYPEEYGFTNAGLKMCYACEGAFNYTSMTCEDERMTLCDEPDTYVSWDGIHLTEAAYKIIAKSLFQGPYTKPEFNSVCHMTSMSHVGAKFSSFI